MGKRVSHFLHSPSLTTFGSVAPLGILFALGALAQSQPPLPASKLDLNSGGQCASALDLWAGGAPEAMYPNSVAVVAGALNGRSGAFYLDGRAGGKALFFANVFAQPEQSPRAYASFMEFIDPPAIDLTQGEPVPAALASSVLARDLRSKLDSILKDFKAHQREYADQTQRIKNGSGSTDFSPLVREAEKALTDLRQAHAPPPSSTNREEPNVLPKPDRRKVSQALQACGRAQGDSSVAELARQRLRELNGEPEPRVGRGSSATPSNPAH